MTISKRRSDLDDDRLRTAIAYGFGSTHEEAAEFSGKSVSTVRRWQDDPEIKLISEAVAAARALERSRNVRETAEKVVASQEDRMRSILERSLKQSERMLSQIEAEDSPDFQKLLAVHQNLTMWATKFFMSEAPKRMQVEASHEHKHIVLTAADAERIFLAKQQLHRMPLIAEGAEVIDADTN